MNLELYTEKQALGKRINVNKYNNNITAWNSQCY